APGTRCSATGRWWPRWASVLRRSSPWARPCVRNPCAIPSTNFSTVLPEGVGHMRVAEKLSENILDKFSMDFLRNQVLKNAYGNNDTVIAAMDPQLLLVWYLFFGLVPWFVND